MTNARMLALAAMFLLFAGFGCKNNAQKKTVIPNPPTTQVTQTPSSTQPSQGTNSTSPADILYLRQTLRNLIQANTFRSDLKIPNAQGLVTGHVEFVRQTGLHGVLNLPGSIRSEIFLVGSSVYFRSNTSTWFDLTSSQEGQKVSEALRSLFALNDKNENSPISDSAKILSITNDASGCKLYTFTQTISTGAQQMSDICVQNDLPTRLRAYTPNGTIEVRYYDLNSPIQIITPVKK